MNKDMNIHGVSPDETGVEEVIETLTVKGWQDAEFFMLVCAKNGIWVLMDDSYPEEDPEADPARVIQIRIRMCRKPDDPEIALHAENTGEAFRLFDLLVRVGFTKVRLDFDAESTGGDYYRASKYLLSAGRRGEEDE